MSQLSVTSVTPWCDSCVTVYAQSATTVTPALRSKRNKSVTLALRVEDCRQGSADVRHAPADHWQPDSDQTVLLGSAARRILKKNSKDEK